MKRTLGLILALVLVFSGCAVKNRSLRLETDDSVQGLSGAEVEADLRALETRIFGLWNLLTDQKLTAHLTKSKLAPYFMNEQELSEFIAIYASLFRELSFRREIVQKYELNKITIEPNGVIALVDIEVRGRIYFIWQAMRRCSLIRNLKWS